MTDKKRNTQKITFINTRALRQCVRRFEAEMKVALSALMVERTERIRRGDDSGKVRQG